MDSWLLLQTKPRQELRALENLERQGIACFCPMARVARVLRGRRCESDEPLFPGYIFVYLTDSSPSFLSLRSTRGVARVVSFGSQMAVVPGALIDSLRGAVVGDAVYLSRVPEKGERVEILSGPFCGLNAIFSEPDGEMRAIVLVTLLSQQVSASIPYDNLRKVG